MTGSRADSDLPAGEVYTGKAGATRTEALHLRQAGGALRSVEVYRAINVHTHPELEARVLSGQVNRLEDGGELAVTFVYHDPTAQRFALVIPPSLAHLELKERARLMTELADDAEHFVPEYVREGTTVLGIDELHRYLASPALQANGERLAEGQGAETASQRPAPSAAEPASPHPGRPPLDSRAARSPLLPGRRAAQPRGGGWLAGLAQLLSRTPASADVAADRLSRSALSPVQRIAFTTPPAPPPVSSRATGVSRPGVAVPPATPAAARAAGGTGASSEVGGSSAAVVAAGAIRDGESGRHPAPERLPPDGIASRVATTAQSARPGGESGDTGDPEPKAATAAVEPPVAGLADGLRPGDEPVRPATSEPTAAHALVSPAAEVAGATGEASRVGETASGPNAVAARTTHERFRPSLRSPAVKAASLPRPKPIAAPAPAAEPHEGAAALAAVPAPTAPGPQAQPGDVLASRIPQPEPEQPDADCEQAAMATPVEQAPNALHEQSDPSARRSSTSERAPALEPEAALHARIEALPLLGMARRCDASGLTLFVKLDAKRAGAFDDEAELLVQWAVRDGRPLVVLAVVGEGKSVARMALDGLSVATRALLERLGRDFRAQLVTSVDGELSEPRAIIAPREFNARAILARLTEGSFEPQGEAHTAIARCLADPPRVRDPHAPFGPARLPPATPANVLAAVSQLAEWQAPGKLDEAMLAYSVPKHVIDAWQRRVLRSAHSVGIALPECVFPLVREQSLAGDGAVFVREQLTAFRSRVERAQNDLDPAATQRNWELLLTQAEALGLALEPGSKTLPRPPAPPEAVAQS